MSPPLKGYRRMAWVVGSLDDAHWDPTPETAREKNFAKHFRQENRESTEMVAVPNVFDLFSTICGTEDVLIVSSRAVTSPLHEGNSICANVGDPQSDDDFFPRKDSCFAGMTLTWNW